MRYPILFLIAALTFFFGRACTKSLTAHAEEHQHSCRPISDVPNVASCCRLRQGDSCALWGKMACRARGCECGATCSPVCTGCVAHDD